MRFPPVFHFYIARRHLFSPVLQATVLAAGRIAKSYKTNPIRLTRCDASRSPKTRYPYLHTNLHSQRILKHPTAHNFFCVLANAHLRHWLAPVGAIITLLAVPSAQAQTETNVAQTTKAFDHCAIAQGAERYTFERVSKQYPDPALKDAVMLSADSAESDSEDPEQIILKGKIAIENDVGILTADSAKFDPRTNTADVDGQVVYESEGLQVESADATLNIEEGTFTLGESGFEVVNSGVVSQGRAASIMRDIEGNLRLQGATYSNCPAGDNGWLIRADNIKLDPVAGIGTARNITLRFKDVPIFYAPAFSFPISNQRKSGFLVPRIDQTEETGFEYRQPFYWNIKPDWDATFVFRLMSDRGLQLQSELRHLNSIGSWILNQEIIGNDRRFPGGSSRHFTRFRHLGDLGRRWTTEIDVNNVSDRDYFEDLGDTLKIASITHLERRADLTYSAENYAFRTRLLTYQTVDEAIIPEERPYRQLPQLTFSYHKPLDNLGLDASFDSEWVYFDRDDSIVGSRLDVAPRLEWSKNNLAWFSTVATTLRHTFYDLNNLDSKYRTVPILSADFGMYFDRFNEADGSLLTLEPRLFYLYANRASQDALPVFDSAALDFNFSQLFRENSFSGGDRINDANQVSLAFSSRLLDEAGREKFQASIGQILYFQDRTVTLPGDLPETTSSSDIVAELKLEFDKNWSGESAIQWTPSTTTTERSSAAIRYRDGKDRLVTLGHRFIRDEGEFINASFAWPIADNWRVASGWTYSLDDDSSIETVLGLEYDSCCWAVRTAARRFITDDGEENNTAFFIQLVLKGLGQLGQNATDVIREAVGGYNFGNG